MIKRQYEKTRDGVAQAAPFSCRYGGKDEAVTEKKLLKIAIFIR